MHQVLGAVGSDGDVTQLSRTIKRKETVLQSSAVTVAIEVTWVLLQKVMDQAVAARATTVRAGR